MPSLTIREPGRVAVEVPLCGTVTIGRDPACEIALTHRSVSRRHAQIRERDGAFFVSDLGSTHGTLVEGERAEDRRLQAGDKVTVGAIVLEYAPHDVADEEIAFHPAATLDLPRAGGEARRLAILFDVTRAFGQITDGDALAERALEAALRAFQCERGLVGLKRAAGGLRRVARGGDIAVSRTIMNALLERQERVLVAGRQALSAPSLMREGVRAAMGVPIVAAEGCVGFIYVDDRSRADRFSVAELDFLTVLAGLLGGALDRQRERRRLDDLAEAMQRLEGSELIGASPAMQRLRRDVQRYALAGDTPVLIRGESGTGKELVARSLHAQSPRKSGPFVTVNCAAMPDTMIESELFGHERGAFTGAVKAYPGRFALAEDGTLFLDEVGDLSAAGQAKLLRALESGEVQRLGAEQPVEIDVRVIAATHRPLEAEMAAGRFREDLYYRLAVGEVVVPPLRARGDDVLLLAELFRERCAGQLGRAVTGFTPACLDALRAYPFPGNVRQLRNEIERAVILCEGAVVEALGLPPARPPAPVGEAHEPIAEAPASLEDNERRAIESALRAHAGNIQAAARALGVSRGLLYRKIAKYQLPRG